MATRADEMFQHNQGQPFSYLEPAQLCTPATSCATPEKLRPVSALKLNRSQHASSTGESCGRTSTIISFQRGSQRDSHRAHRRLKRPSLANRLPTRESFRRTHSDLRSPVSSRQDTISTLTLASEDKAETSRQSSKMILEEPHCHFLSAAESKTAQNSQYQQRLHIAQELLDTEQKYVDDLFVIQFNFIEPMVQSLRVDTPILSAAKMSEIFSNFVDILHINSALLALVQERLDPFDAGVEASWDPATGCLGDIFASFGHYLKMYKIYCRNFTAASIALQAEMKDNTAFNAFLNSAESKAALAGLTLHGQLLKPVQQVPRYRMLLSELLRYTDNDHADYAALMNAMSVIESVATGINESIRRHESWQELRRIEAQILNLDAPLSLSPSRMLIKHGPVARIGNRSHQLCEFFLFNDCLIYATIVTPKAVLNWKHEYYYFRRRIPLDSLNVDPIDQVSSDNHEKIGNRCLWRITSTSVSFIAYSSTKESRNEWLELIRRAKSEHMLSPSSFQSIPKANGTLLIRRGRPTSRIPVVKLPLLKATILWHGTEYPIFRNLVPPVWVEDSAAPSCHACNAHFTFFRGRHHCRICGNVVCASCSGKRFMISSSSAALRACISCYDEKLASSAAHDLSLQATAQMSLDSAQRFDVPPIHIGTMGKSMLRTIGRHRFKIPDPTE